MQEVEQPIRIMIGSGAWDDLGPDYHAWPYDEKVYFALQVSNKTGEEFVITDDSWNWIYDGIESNLEGPGFQSAEQFDDLGC